jgi:hypothetical protein
MWKQEVTRVFYSITLYKVREYFLVKFVYVIPQATKEYVIVAIFDNRLSEKYY